jgi:Flp pilus assembly protein CpaB
MSAPVVAGIVVITLVAGSGALWATGLLDLSRLRGQTRSLAGLTAVPVAARAIPAYTRINRDHFWNPQAQQLTVVYLPKNSVTPGMLIQLSDILGRVLDHEKPAGFVFTEADFLPKGTREGVVGGIPAGKRAMRVEAEKVQGLYGLRAGDRFDLVATLPITAAAGGRGAFNATGAYSSQLALQAQLSNWQKQATVHVMAQNGVLVEPMTTRQVPVFSRTLTQGGVTRMRPVQEAVIAIDPDEVAQLTQAMAVDAEISVVPRSGRPDDPLNSVTPGLKPVNPFTNTSTGFPAATSDGTTPTPTVPFTMIERITGSGRELTAVPSR